MFKDVESNENIKRTKLSVIKERMQLEFGLGGIVTPAFLICAFLRALDLILIYLLAYNLCACIAIVLIYVKKAMQHKNETLS